MPARLLRRLVLALCVTPLLSPAAGQAQEPQPGDSCSGKPAGAYTRSAGQQIPGGHVMVCDGSTWISLLDYADSGRSLLQIGHDPGSCTSAKQGRLRYTSASDLWAYCDGTSWVDLASGSGTGSAAGADRQIQFNSGGSFGADANFVFTSIGRLGFGTPTPDAPVHLRSGTNNILTIDTTQSTGSPLISLKQNGTRRAFWQYFDGNDTIRMINEYGGILFWTGTGGSETERMRITQNGTVGIGTTSPAVPLDVAGVMRAVDDAAGCTSTERGAIRFNSAGGALELCDGGTWGGVGSGGSGLWSDSGSGYIEYNSALGGARIGDVSGQPAPNIIGVTNLNDLGDVNVPGPTGQQVLTYDSVAGEWVAGAGAAGDFIGLTDTPSSYIGAAGQFAKVNATPDGLTFSALALSDLPAIAVDDLSDATVTSPASDEVLSYNGSNWVNGALTLSHLPAIAVSDLSDTSIGSPASDEVLTYNGSNWVNAVLSASSLNAAGTDRQIQFNSGGSFAADANLVFSSVGRLGIGTASPGAMLEVAGQVKITGGTPGSGKVLTSDSAGLATWQAISESDPEVGSLTSGKWCTSDGSAVNCTSDAPPSVFTDLGDTPADYSGAAGQFVKVNGTPDALAFGTIALSDLPAIALNDLSDASISGPASGEVLTYNGSNWVNAVLSASSVNAAGADRQIQFNSGGSFGANANFVFDASGNVGIGTNSPQRDLHVEGDLRLSETNDPDGGWAGVLSFDAPGSIAPADTTHFKVVHTVLAGGAQLQFRTLNDDETDKERLLVLDHASGNVGIGTASPSGKLSIVGGYKTTGVSADGGLVISTQGSSPDKAQVIWGDGTGWKLHFGTDSGGNFAELVTFVDTGNVGIGTASPNTQLEIVGNQSNAALYVRNNTTSGEFIEGINDGGVGVVHINALGDGSGYIGLDDASDVSKVALSTSGASYFNGGNVGIGDETPDHLLDVDGNIGLTAGRYLNFGDTDGSTGYGIRDNAGTIECKDSGGSWSACGGGGSGDNLGDHTATQNILLNGNWLSNDGGNEGVFVDTVGNVGIGTAAPTDKLHVNGTGSGSGTEGPAIRIGANTGPRIVAMQETADTDAQGLAFFTHPSSINADPPVEMVRIDHQGQVGLGTTSPDYRLHVDNSGGNSSVKINAANGSHAYLRLTEESATDYGGLLKYDGTNNRFEIGTLEADTEVPAIYIPRNSGNVGIGTASPNSDLHVHPGPVGGNIQLTSYTALGNELSGAATVLGNNVRADTVNNSQMEILTTHSSFGARAIRMADEVGIAFHTVDGSVTAGNAFSFERMRIDENGNVGIGTATPSGKLEVVQSDTPSYFWRNGSQGLEFQTYISGNRLRSLSSPSNAKSLILDATTDAANTAPSAGSNNIILRVRGSEKMRIDAGGNVGIGDSTPDAKLDVNGNIIANDPSASNHVATKNYVDNNAGGAPSCVRRSASTSVVSSISVSCNAGEVMTGGGCEISSKTRDNYPSADDTWFCKSNQFDPSPSITAWAICCTF